MEWWCLTLFLCGWRIADGAVTNSGGFAILDDLIHDPTVVYAVRKSATVCQCQHLCLDDDGCLSYSAYPSGPDSFRCSLGSKYPVDDLPLIKRPLSKFGIYLSPYTKMENDGFIYSKGSSLVTWNDADTECSGKNYSSLPTVKTTVSHYIIIQVYNDFWVNMYDNAANKPQWADGTLFSQTQLQDLIYIYNNAPGIDYYVWTGNSYYGVANNTNHEVLCQVDLLGFRL